MTHFVTNGMYFNFNHQDRHFSLIFNKYTESTFSITENLQNILCIVKVVDLTTENRCRLKSSLEPIHLLAEVDFMALIAFD